MNLPEKTGTSVMAEPTSKRHSLFVHSWLSKNKMDLVDAKSGKTPSTNDLTTATHSDDGKTQHQYSVERKRRTNRLHRNETIVVLTIAGMVNAGILIVAVSLFHGIAVNANLTVNQFVSGMDKIYGRAIGILFALTLLASGLSSSALGTIAGQVIMDGLTGIRANI